MKNLFLIISLISTFSFASCKKEYSCVCVSTANGSSATQESKIKDTKRKAGDECKSRSTTSTAFGIAYTTECSLK